MSRKLGCSFYIISLFLFFYSCKKQEPKIDENLEVIEIFNSGKMTFGYIKSLKNDIEWASSSVAKRDLSSPYASIAGYTYLNEKEDFFTESLILLVPLEVKKYDVLDVNSNLINNNKSYCRFKLLENDATLSSFLLNEKVNTNYIEVTKLDSTHIEGFFDLTFKCDYNCNKIKQDRRFSRGSFNVMFIK